MLAKHNIDTVWNNSLVLVLHYSIRATSERYVRYIPPTMLHGQNSMVLEN